jgi:Flp pilus assembly protein TadG
MRHAITLISLLCASCCTSDKCIAITESNVMHDAGEAAAETLRVGCTERYKTADSLPQVAELDKPCLPAAKAYGEFSKAQTRVQAMLAAALAGDESGALSQALLYAKEAAAELARAIGEMP